MRRQGLIPTPPATPIKASESPNSPSLPMDAPLMFDFALPEDRDEGWR